MDANGRGNHSAAPVALGYIYQVRYALYESLKRLREGQEFIVSIETMDDVVFEQDGRAPELLQTKHHLARAADLTDSSQDLWKTIRIWSNALANGKIPKGTIFFLITTSEVGSGHAASFLLPGSSRDCKRAMERLNATADSSANKANQDAYYAYRALSLEQRMRMLEAVYIVDSTPKIDDLFTEIKKVLYYAVEQRFLDNLIERLEGWWYRRTITHLVDDKATPILGEEIETETSSLREQFKKNSLPIDDDILRASVDASGYRDRLFVHQLRLIEIGNNRIFYAIRDFFRAYEQRSRWVREDLLLIGELERYEDSLVEEWAYLFEQMRDEVGEEATSEAKKLAANALYKWVETETHPQIRTGVREPFISRGTYHILSDAQRVGWHVEFKNRLSQILEPQDTSL